MPSSRHEEKNFIAGWAEWETVVAHQKEKNRARKGTKLNYSCLAGSCVSLRTMKSIPTLACALVSRHGAVVGKCAAQARSVNSLDKRGDSERESAYSLGKSGDALVK
jgi:hypothetical protein